MSETKTRQMSFTVLEDGSVRADFGEGIDPITFMPASLPETLFPQALAKGFIINLQGATSRLSGDDRTPAALRDAVAERLDGLKAGKWGVERVAGEGDISIEAEAAHVYRQDRAAAKGETFTGTLADTAADFALLSDEQKEKLKAVSGYKLAYAKVKASRAAKKAEKMAKKVTTEGEVDFI